MSQLRLRTGVVSSVAVIAALALTGCASHRFVRENIAVVDTRVTEVQGTARDALDRANAAHKLAEGKFLYEMVLSDDSVKFPVEQHALSPEAEARLAELGQRLKSENRNVYLEVGYAWGCGKPTVLLVRDEGELKFDVRGQRCLVYRSIRNLEEQLRKELNGLKASGGV